MRFGKVFLAFAFAWGLSGQADPRPKLRLACVDCYSTASLIPFTLQRLFLGIEVEWVLVQTHKYSEGDEAYFSAFPPGTLRLPQVDMENPAEVTALVKRLAGLGVDRILASTDEGSFQSSVLNERMGFPDNSPDTRDERRKKRPQARALLEYGIPTHTLKSPEALLAFMAEYPNDEFVFKPNRGRGGVDVTMMHRDDPLLPQFIADRLDDGAEWLVQPRIIGEEYYVNTFTDNGVTKITGLWKYYKILYKGMPLYFVDRPIDLNSALALELGPIVNTINQRVGLKNGPAHIEMMKEASTGRWWTVENNGRVVGSGVTEVEHKVWGLSHLDLYLLWQFDRARFEKEFANFPRPMLNDAILFEVPSVNGGLKRRSGIEFVTNRPTFLNPGPQYTIASEGSLPFTRDLFSAAFSLRYAGETAAVQNDFGASLNALLEEKLFGTEDCENTAVPAEMREILLTRQREIRWDQPISSNSDN